MKLSDFDYSLPKELIAQYPLKQRDESRMLVLDKTSGAVKHRYFYNLPQYLDKNDAIVLNDTKVFKARLIGKRAGFSGKIELLLLKEKDKNHFECLVNPAKRVKIGTTLEFEKGLKAEVVDKKDEIRLIKFNANGNVYSIFEEIGLMPLPPYIKRSVETEDEISYQTIYAKKPGAVAAPTAGLHFTNSIMDKIKQKGVSVAYITLHVGYATFRPVDCENINEHKMHSENFEISTKTTEQINKARQQDGRILAIGTTTCRAIESTAPSTIKGETDLFIYPGYKFKITDMLLTNFHLPKTTLLMLVCAFGGYDNVMKAYQEAIEKKYRFYSYGDCMLIV